MGDVDVSVVTVSFGRVPTVVGKLEALAGQAAAATLEIVLLDNACPDRVGDVVAARAWPFPVRVLRSDVRLAAGEARARATDAAAGRFVWWSDDDVVPHDTALAAHLAAQARRAGVGVGSIRFVTDRRTQRLRAHRPGPAQVTGANTFFPRAAYAAAGRVPAPALGRPYGGEDTVVGVRLRRSGATIFAVPDAWVDHHGPSPEASSDLRKAYDAGYNAAVVAAWAPEVAWALGVHPLQVALKAAVLPVLVPLGPRFAGERAFQRGARAAREDAHRGPGAVAS